MKRSVVTIVLAALALGAAACSAGESNAAGSRGADAAGRKDEARPVVRGHVLDRATREALVGARIEGPAGQSAVSGAQGFFEIRGFEIGEEGPLTARLDDGREGQVTLRPLEPGPLEVVLYLTD